MCREDRRVDGEGALVRHGSTLHGTQYRCGCGLQQAIAERRKLRVLLSTHNPAMLDALPDAAVPDVVFCYRDPASGASKLIRMAEIPDAPELLVQGPLGHLMTTGALDRFVKKHPGLAVRKQKAKAWLEALRADKSGVDG